MSTHAGHVVLGSADSTKNPPPGFPSLCKGVPGKHTPHRGSILLCFGIPSRGCTTFNCQAGPAPASVPRVMDAPLRLSPLCAACYATSAVCGVQYCKAACFLDHGTQGPVAFRIFELIFFFAVAFEWILGILPTVLDISLPLEIFLFQFHV